MTEENKAAVVAQSGTISAAKARRLCDFLKRVYAENREEIDSLVALRQEYDRSDKAVSWAEFKAAHRKEGSHEAVPN